MNLTELEKKKKKAEQKNKAIENKTKNRPTQRKLRAWVR